MKMASFLPRALGAALAVLLLCAAPAKAQDGKFGLYVGYSFLKSDDGNLHGGRLSPEYRFKSFASIVGDFSLEKGSIASSDAELTTFLGGVRLKRGLGSVSLFVHALAGGARSTDSISPVSGVTISVKETGLALDAGGGVEFKVSRFTMRVGADYLRRKIEISNGRSKNLNDIRATVGLVF